MTLYSNMQICGEARITIERRDGTVWVSVKDGNQTITMEGKHVHQLWDALAASEQAIATFMAVDAAEAQP